MTQQSQGEEKTQPRGKVAGVVADGGRLVRMVGVLTGLSRRHAGRAIEAGGVYIDGRRCRLPGAPVRAGQALEIWPDAKPTAADADLEVLLEDPGLWVVDKPAGLPSDPPRQGGDALTLRLAERYGVAQVYASHRLDRDASGLLAVARNPHARETLDAALRSRRVERGYLALVCTWVAPQAQVIDEPLQPMRGRSKIAPWGAPARTHITPLGFDRARGMALVGVRLESGRMHQARAHLAHAVGAIAGDRWYGDSGPKRGRVALHAAWLRIPGGRGLPSVDVHQPPGPDFWALACNDGVSADLSLPEDWLSRLQALTPGHARID